MNGVIFSNLVWVVCVVHMAVVCSTADVCEHFCFICRQFMGDFSFGLLTKSTP